MIVLDASAALELLLGRPAVSSSPDAAKLAASPGHGAVVELVR